MYLKFYYYKHREVIEYIFKVDNAFKYNPDAGISDINVSEKKKGGKSF